MKKKDFLICLLLAVSIGMNFFQDHIIKSQFDFLEEDVTLFRKSMNLMDSLETANHGLFIKLMELAVQAKNECADYIIETEIENGWPLHPNKCRAGCTSKPIAKPPYWHRIRSYCVTTKYH